MEDLATGQNQVTKVHLSKRKSQRVEVKLPVRFTDLLGKYQHGKTKNLSTGGAFICSENSSMPIGTYTDLCIDFPNDPPILVFAKVVWVNRYGFGVKFLRLEVNDKNMIRNLVRKNGKILL